MQLRHVIAAAVLAVFATSCKLGDSADTASINVYLEVSDSQLTVGVESIDITVTARNVGYDVLTLTGPSDCLLFVEVFDNQGIRVWTSNASCAGTIVTEDLAAGQDKVQVFTWGGTDTVGQPLSPGPYVVRGIARMTTGAYAGPPVSIALD